MGSRRRETADGEEEGASSPAYLAHWCATGGQAGRKFWAAEVAFEKASTRPPTQIFLQIIFQRTEDNGPYE